MVAKCLVVVHLVVPCPIHAGGVGYGSEVGLVLLIVGRAHVVYLCDTRCIEYTFTRMRIVWREGGCELQTFDDVGTQVDVAHHRVLLGLVGVVAIFQVNQWVVGRCELCIRTKSCLGTRVGDVVAILVSWRYEWVEIECINVWRISSVGADILCAAHCHVDRESSLKYLGKLGIHGTLQVETLIVVAFEYVLFTLVAESHAVVYLVCGTCSTYEMILLGSGASYIFLPIITIEIWIHHQFIQLGILVVAAAFACQEGGCQVSICDGIVWMTVGIDTSTAGTLEFLGT